MGNLGGGEILVILLLALIVLGPERLPTVARQIGKVMGDVRRVSAGFQAEVRAAIDETGLNDLKDEMTGKAPVPKPGATLPPAPVASPVATPPQPDAISADDAVPADEAVPGEQGTDTQTDEPA
jgi:sec-independent protein translocase protein TatB